MTDLAPIRSMVTPKNEARLDEERQVFGAWLLYETLPEHRDILDELRETDFETPSLREAVRVWREHGPREGSPNPVAVGALLDAHLSTQHPSPSDLVIYSAEYVAMTPSVLRTKVERMQGRREAREKAAISREYLGALSDLAHAVPGLEAEPEARVADAERRLREIELVGTWEEPDPLPGSASSETFPLDTLGSLGRDYAKAVAHSKGTPEEIPAVTMLGIVSTVVAGAMTVSPKEGWIQPVNLYTVALLQPGEGKSPVLSEMISPLHEIERERNEQHGPARREAQLERDLTEDRLANAKKAATRAKDTASRMEAEHEARDLGEQLAQMEVPAPPRVYTSEATPEALASLLADQRGRMAVITDEGSEFFQLASRYQSNGSANLGVYLKGADGDRYVMDRKGRPEPVIIERVTLTVSLMAQSVVLDELRRDPQMAGRGLLARFLWTQPPTLVGWRETDRDPIPQHLSDAYAERVRNLAREADALSEPVTLTLDHEAGRIWRDWNAQHEPRLRAEVGDLANLKEWGAKLPGQVLRLTGVLHALRTGSIRGVIGADTMTAALELSDYFTSHARAVFGQMRSETAVVDARAALEWLRARPRPVVLARDLVRSKSWDTERGKAALDTLTRYGWLQDAPPSGKRGRPEVAYLVHPEIQNP